MSSSTSRRPSIRGVILGEELEFRSGWSPEDCKRLLSARTTLPLIGFARDSPSPFREADDWRRVEHLRSEGILLQGRIRAWTFDVCCLEKLTGLRGNHFRPHYTGHFDSCAAGTAVVGKVGLRTLAKVWLLFCCLSPLLFVVLGIAAKALPLIFGGAAFFAVGDILAPGFAILMARDEWQELPETLRCIFS